MFLICGEIRACVFLQSVVCAKDMNKLMTVTLFVTALINVQLVALTSAQARPFFSQLFPVSPYVTHLRMTVYPA